jgi:2-polyprenyl-6-methoxyphenol hydroxylase-like FAD-dependent oxidoreductase
VRILISGAGIAGPTLAYWLLRFGHEPTLVENAAELRSGGYVIDFWGAGFDIAERMGLLPELKRRGYAIQEVRMVDDCGHRVGGFSTGVFGRLTGGRYLSIARSELAAALYGTIETQVETLFGESITALEEDDREIHVSFERSETRTFDLVIGADGLHSNVRGLVFGDEARFEKYLGYKVAAFEATGYRPRDPDVYVMYTQVGQQVGRFSMRDDRTLFLFVFADSNPDGAQAADVGGQKTLLRERFGSSGWECAQIVRALQASDTLYFDRVSQIRMECWSRGRVALLGDAASCVSLLAGQGSALAMVAAYVLAGELEAAGWNHRTAFARYQERLAAFIARKQRAAERFAGFFAPRSAAGLFLRNQLTKVLAVPFVARFTVARDLIDELDLPEY